MWSDSYGLTLFGRSLGSYYFVGWLSRYWLCLQLRNQVERLISQELVHKQGYVRRFLQSSVRTRFVFRHQPGKGRVQLIDVVRQPLV